MVQSAQLLARNYHVVVTNPPYAGAKGLNPTLVSLIEKEYPDAKTDLFSVFMERCCNISANTVALVTPSSWMYNPRFEKFRKKFLENTHTISLLELGSNGFEGGFGTATYVLNKNACIGYCGSYYDVSDNLCEHELEISEYEKFICKQSDFLSVDGQKIIFKIPPKLREVILQCPQLQIYGTPGNGLQTNDNGRFIHEWYEVNLRKIDFARAKDVLHTIGKKWYPTVKTTSSTKWYGNMSSIVNWENDGAEIKALTVQKYGTYSKHVQNMKYYFVEGLTWSHSTYGAPFAIRYMPSGVIINIEGPGIFELGEKMYYTLGLLNSNVAMMIFENTTGSIHFVASDLARFPMIYNDSQLHKIDALVIKNISTAKQDWDSYETSWDFKCNPLV